MLDENKLLFDELYEKTRNFGRVQFINLLMAKEREIKELKKQLEEMDSKLFFTKNELEMRQKSIDNKLRQQKEFIEYLTNYIGSLNSLEIVGNREHYYELSIVRKILSKYKEIIGIKNE